MGQYRGHMPRCIYACTSALVVPFRSLVRSGLVLWLGMSLVDPDSCFWSSLQSPLFFALCRLTVCTCLYPSDSPTDKWCSSFPSKQLQDGGHPEQMHYLLKMYLYVPLREPKYAMLVA